MAKKMKPSNEYKGILLPGNLTSQADMFIRNIIDSLEKEERLTTTDSTALYMLAGQFNTYIKAKELEDEKGLTTVSPTGLVSIAAWTKIANDTFKNVVRMLSEMGCTLKSRKQFKVMDENGAEEESPLAQFMKQSQELM